MPSLSKDPRRQALRGCHGYVCKTAVTAAPARPASQGRCAARPLENNELRRGLTTGGIIAPWVIDGPINRDASRLMSDECSSRSCRATPSS